MIKYGGITKDQYLEMDVIEVQKLCSISGMPESVQKLIWKKTANDDYVKKAIEKVKNDNR